MKGNFLILLVTANTTYTTFDGVYTKIMLYTQNNVVYTKIMLYTQQSLFNQSD